MKALKRFFVSLVLFVSCFFMTGCDWDSLFILSNGSSSGASEIEMFEGCENAIFFALYNYYGYPGQHFTNKWMGMLDALNNHGIEVTNWEGVKDATQFKIKRTADCDLPEDAIIYMVNNQNWDSGIQFNIPFAKYSPMVVISTCNGVEFASNPIAASGIGISNATMGGFSDTYKQAMEKGTLHYISAKYAAHILPIVAACVDAVDNGSTLRNADGTALSLSVENWAIQTLDQYNELEMIDSINPEQPTLRFCNISKFFDRSSSEYGAENLNNFITNSSVSTMKELYELNGTNASSDTVRTGRKLKCGVLQPSSVNDQVRKYLDYLNGYCAQIFNLEIVPYSVTSTNTQDIGAQALCDQGVDFILSLQDDTNRNKSIDIANNNKVYYGIIGTTQNPNDYKIVKDLPYYVGSVGTSIDEERRAACEMTEFYLQCMIARAKGEDELIAFQRQWKGLDSKEEE